MGDRPDLSPAAGGCDLRSNHSGRRAHASAGIVLVIAAALLWGTAGLTGALLHERSGMPAASIGFWRLAVGALGTLPLLLRNGMLRSLRPHGVRLAAVGTALGIYQVCFYAAVTLAGVSLATLVTLGTAPVLIGAGSHLLARTRTASATGQPAVRRATVVAIGAALAGLMLLAGAPARGVSASAALAGAGLALTSAAGYAVVTLVGQRRPSGTPVAAFTAGSFWVAALVTLPLAARHGLTLPGDAAGLALLGYLGLGPTALAYVLFFRGLRSVEATTASVLTLVEPATATLLAVVLLGERLGARGAAGAAVLLGTAAVLAAIQMRSSEGHAVTSAAGSSGPRPRSQRRSA